MNQPINIASLPILRPGDRMDRDEFERRWDAMPHLKHAELIDGVVFMASPTSWDHCWSNGRFGYWLNLYSDATPGTAAGVNGSLRVDSRNEFQPDALLRIVSPTLRRSSIENRLIRGAPELVVEVSISSASYDRGRKRDIYERIGVQEYLIWRPEDELFEWFVLQDGAYQPLLPGEDGVFRSVVFPGLWLNLQGLTFETQSQMPITIREGIATPEYAAFVARLQAAASQPETPS